MKHPPRQRVARLVAKPALLPRFDPAWKAKCLSCAHSIVTGSEMRCTQRNPARTPGAVAMLESRNVYGYCIDARDHDGECGPGANLWRAK